MGYIDKNCWYKTDRDRGVHPVGKWSIYCNRTDEIVLCLIHKDRESRIDIRDGWHVMETVLSVEIVDEDNVRFVTSGRDIVLDIYDCNGWICNLFRDRKSLLPTLVCELQAKLAGSAL